MVRDIPEHTLKQIRRMGKLLNALSSVSPVLAGRLAFRIFCTPRKLPEREKDRGFLSSARQATMQAGGQRIRTYLWESENPNARTILFLHGWESNSGRWNTFVKAAREAGFRVQAFDAPASGNSNGRLLNVILYARVLRQFIAENGAPYAIVGHSLGGAAAVMSLALLEAERPQKLVLLACFAESTRVIYDFAEILGVNEVVLQAIFKHIERRSGMPIAEYSVLKKVVTLKAVDGLVLHDLNDAVAPVSEGRDIAASWGSKFLQTEGLGHRMQDKKVVREVTQFLVA